MPTNYSAAGSALGTAAGAYFGGPVGASIGGSLGGAIGGMFDENGNPRVPILPATRYPGAVSSPYGSMIYDPVTGSTRYVQNQNLGGYNPSSYQDAALYDALMGGNSASSGLTNQIQQQQLMLNQLRAQGGGKAPTYADYHLKTDANGNLLKATDYINKGGTDMFGQSRGENPFWEEFMRQTGGQFGGASGDIAYAKWAREVEKNSAPDLQAYENAVKVYGTNSEAANNAIQQQELQLAQLKAMAGDPASASSGVSNNPMLQILQQQEAAANDPSYLRAMNAQSQSAYDNQLQAQEQALAARGLGASGLAEMTRARMGLQLGNTFNQNALAANQMATDKRQAALNNRMNMLNFLSGRKDSAFNQGMQQQNLGMQQIGMASGYGMQNLNNAMQRDIAQAGIQSQYDLSNYNRQMAQNQQSQNNWASALGGIGYGLGGYMSKPKQEEQIGSAPSQSDNFNWAYGWGGK